MGRVDELLPQLKANLIIDHNTDDELLRGLIRAAIDYAEGYQHYNYADDEELPPATQQAVIMHATHFYESRDGGTAGFLSGTVGAARHVWDAIHRLLSMNKWWKV